MTDATPENKIPEIANLLDELERLAPQTDDAPRTVVYRISEGTNFLNDALDEQEEETFDELGADQLDWAQWQEQEQLPFVEEVDLRNLSAPAVPTVAIDSGLARLGETEDGLIIALRGTIVIVTNGDTELNLYRTGPIYLRNQDRLRILHMIGASLNKPDIFVELENDTPVKVKSGVADDSQKYADRFRNWFERILQRIAVQAVSYGLVLIDGALTKNTRDTPTEFLNELEQLAVENGNAIVGISKQSRLQVGTRSVRFWLSETPGTICYRRLSQLMSKELRQRVMGSTYAIRFSPSGATFRVDVKPTEGQTEYEAIETIFSSCLIRGGYPDILVRAHAHSYFTSPSMAELQAQCGAKYRLRAEPELELTGIFGPFGGRFK